MKTTFKTKELGLVSHSFSIKLETQKAPEFVDITDRVKELVAKSGVQNGLCVVFSRHTTMAVRINENEPLLIEDMEKLLEHISPRNANYRHNDFTIRTVNMTEEECPNGHAHCQHLFLSTSESIPIIDGRLYLGRWQSIFVVELDHARPREVVVQVLGV